MIVDIATAILVCVLFSFSVSSHTTSIGAGVLALLV
jgi:hypothetical protein